MRRLIIAVVIAGFCTSCGNSDECPVGFFDCGYGCTELLSDPQNCGACMNACLSGHICLNGICTLSCQEGYADCGGTCRDLLTDQYNCGTCGLTCAAGYVCIDGSCAPDCPDGYTSCSGMCKNLNNDPSNCGACANMCASGEVCMAGTCTFTCPAPYIDCSGTCADLQSDHLNCGACGSACLSGQICEAGACQNSCIAGLTLCSGACVDLMRDPENCGSCASRCGTGENCYDGACIASCPGGFTDCSGTCRDLNNDRTNCGACETECGDGEVCEAGVCEILCASPLVRCPHDFDGDTVADGEVCSDTTSDPGNCSACGTVCPRGEACVLGSCETVVCPSPTYSEAFPAGTVRTTDPQCVNWISWMASLDATGCTSIVVSGSLDTTGVACTDPTIVQAIATALRTGATGSWMCDGFTWYTDNCGTQLELVARGAECYCNDPGHLLRPCINNSNWGGVGSDTCSAPAQTMTVAFY